jgi:hypothetical protein
MSSPWADISDVRLKVSARPAGLILLWSGSRVSHGCVKAWSGPRLQGGSMCGTLQPSLTFCERFLTRRSPTR